MTIRNLTGVLALLILWQEATAQTDQRTYRTYKSFPLTEEDNGVTGELRMLVDSRLSDLHLTEPWGMGALDHPNWTQTPDLETKWRSFKILPRLPARIQVVGDDNQVLDELQVTSDDRSSNDSLYLLTSITSHNLRPSGVPSYKIEIRKWASCGSGCGNFDRLLDVQGAEISRLQYYDGKADQSYPILVPVERGSYSFVDRQRGVGKDILIFSYMCDYRFRDGPHQVIYTRMVFENTAWKAYRNTVETSEECSHEYDIEHFPVVD